MSAASRAKMAATCGSSRAPAKTSQAPTLRCAPRWRPSSGSGRVLDGEVVAYRRRPDVLRPAPAAPRGHQADSRAGRCIPGRLLRLRSARHRRRGSHRPSARRAPRQPGQGDPAKRRHCRLTEAWRDDSERRFVAPAGPAGKGSSPSAPTRRTCPVARRDWLKLKCAWEQELVSAVTPIPPAAGRTSAPCSSGTTRTPLGTPERSAPATRRRLFATSAQGCARWRRPSRRSLTRGRSRAEPTGRGPS